jgi:hypothetical protein
VRRVIPHHGKDLQAGEPDADRQGCLADVGG